MTPSEARRTPGGLAPTGGCRCRYLVTLSQEGPLGHALDGFVDIGTSLFHRLHIQPAPLDAVFLRPYDDHLRIFNPVPEKYTRPTPCRYQLCAGAAPLENPGSSRRCLTSFYGPVLCRRSPGWDEQAARFDSRDGSTLGTPPSRAYSSLRVVTRPRVTCDVLLPAAAVLL